MIAIRVQHIEAYPVPGPALSCPAGPGIKAVWHHVHCAAEIAGAGETGSESRQSAGMVDITVADDNGVHLPDVARLEERDHHGGAGIETCAVAWAGIIDQVVAGSLNHHGKALPHVQDVDHEIPCRWPPLVRHKQGHQAGGTGQLHTPILTRDKQNHTQDTNQQGP